MLRFKVGSDLLSSYFVVFFFCFCILFIVMVSFFAAHVACDHTRKLILVMTVLLTLVASEELVGRIKWYEQPEIAALF